MISLVFKFSMAFILSYFILSLNFSSRPLFYHLSELTGPVGDDVKSSITKSVKRSFKKSKELGKQLFNSSEPKFFDDAIQSQQSALRKSKGKKNAAHLIQEELQNEEKIILDQVIEKN